MLHGGILKVGDLQVTMGFNTIIVIHDLDDLGYPLQVLRRWIE